jgi:hypothetical protein
MDMPDLETLNAQLSAWRIVFNASAVHSRLKMPRLQAWLRIRPEQLRVPESPEALRELVLSPAEERVVPDNLVLSYKPKSDKFARHEYALAGIPDLAPGRKISIRVNPYSAPAIDVTVTALDGAERVYTLRPLRETDFGFHADAPILGESFSSRKETRADKALKAIAEEAYGYLDKAATGGSAQSAGASAVGESSSLMDEDSRDASRDRAPGAAMRNMEKSKAKGARAYPNLDIMADLKAARPGLYLPKRGSALEIRPRAIELQPLSVVEAARRLMPLLAAHGLEWTEEHMAALLERYPHGLPAELLDSLSTMWVSEGTCPFGGDSQGAEPSGPPEAAADPLYEEGVA